MNKNTLLTLLKAHKTWSSLTLALSTRTVNTGSDAGEYIDVTVDGSANHRIYRGHREQFFTLSLADVEVA